MPQSVLEKDVARWLYKTKNAVIAHDRGVLFGFLLTLAPFFPMSIFGIVINTLNYNSWKSGKLQPSEGGLIKISFIFGAINILVNVILIYAAFNTATELDWPQLKETISTSFVKITSFPRNILHLLSGVKS